METAANPTTEGQLAARRRRMEIHRIADALDLSQDVMHFEKAPCVSAESDGFRATLMELGLGEGAVVKVLFSDPISNVSLTYAWLKSNFRISPHSHDADCTYYVISGEARLGAEVLRAGDVFFVPADGGYSYEVGPEGVEVLEFRTAAKFNIVYPELSRASFERSAAIIRENREAWAQQEPPAAIRRHRERAV